VSYRRDRHGVRRINVLGIFSAASLTVLWMLGTVNSAFAQTLGTAQASGAVSGGLGNLYVETGGSFSSNGLAISMNYAGGTGAVSATGSGTGSYVYDVASLGYFFEIIGPTNSAVTANFLVSGFTDSSGDAYAGAQAALGSGQSSLMNVCTGTGFYAPSCTTGGSFEGSVQFTVPANTLESMDLGVSGFSLSGNWTATIDPSITLDPATLAAGYTIIYSPDLPGSVVEGVGTGQSATAAPEIDPASTLSALTLLAGLLVVVRARCSVPITRSPAISCNTGNANSRIIL